MDHIDRVEDRQAIVDVCTRYALALDTRDWKLLRECFTADAIAHYEGRSDAIGYPAIEETCRAVLESLAASQHLLGNHLVSLSGDQASATCYFHAQHVRPELGDGATFVVAGRYDDRFVRQKEGWRIAERTLTLMWTAGNPAVLG